MIVAVSSVEAQAKRVLRKSRSDSGAQYFRSDYIAPPGFDAGADSATHMAMYEQLKESAAVPHAFLIDDQTGGPIPSHFHRVAQFQVVAKGRGKLGRRDVSAVSVHYTDPYTGYGPIVPGEQGLSYFTLRMQFDPGANYLDQPGVRERLRPSRKRHLLVHADTVRVSAADELAQRTSTGLDELIAPQDDGVAAYMLRVPPDGAGVGPDPARAGGQFYLVVNGEAVGAGGSLPFLSCVHVSSGEPALGMRAGAWGLEALVLQFPRAAA